MVSFSMMVPGTYSGGLTKPFTWFFQRKKNELQIRWLFVTEVTRCKDHLLLIVNFTLSRF